MAIRLPPKAAASRPTRSRRAAPGPTAGVPAEPGEPASGPFAVDKALPAPTLATHPHPDVAPSEAAIRAFAARSDNLAQALGRLRAPDNKAGTAPRRAARAAGLDAFILEEFEPLAPPQKPGSGAK